jgi:hypothetical protein
MIDLIRYNRNFYIPKYHDFILSDFLENGDKVNKVIGQNIPLNNHHPQTFLSKEGSPPPFEGEVGGG